MNSERKPGDVILWGNPQSHSSMILVLSLVEHKSLGDVLKLLVLSRGECHWLDIRGTVFETYVSHIWPLLVERVGA